MIRQLTKLITGSYILSVLFYLHDKNNACSVNVGQSLLFIFEKVTVEVLISFDVKLNIFLKNEFLFLINLLVFKF